MDFLDFTSYMPDLVYEYVSGVKRVGSDKLNFRCPLCGDGRKSTSHRGWFYVNNGSYFCWNAGCEAHEHGMPGLIFLSKVSGKPVSQIREELIRKAGTFKNALKAPVIKTISSLFQDDEDQKNECSFSDKFKDGTWTKDLPDFVKSYIKDRKLDKAPFLPKSFQFYYDKKEKRLVIPWSNDYYQERTILSSQRNEDKYKFPTDVEKPIFGLDNLDKSFKYIFLLEGVFDAIWCKNGIAVGSLKMSRHQKEILKEYENDFTFVWMPDNQFKDKSSYEETLRITKEMPYDNIFIWPKGFSMFKDVNDTIKYSDDFIELWKSEQFLQSNIYSGLKAKMMLMNF